MSVEINYPKHGNFSLENGNRSINAYDELFVEWWSSWPGVNLSIACLESGQNYHDAPGNPLPPQGICDLGSVLAAGNWTGFPTACVLRLARSDDSTGYQFIGQDFVVTSSSAAPVTFSPVPSSSSLSSLSLTASSTASAASAAPTRTKSSNPSSDTSSLETGAKVGVGMGSGVAFLIVMGVLIGIVRRRSRSKRNIEETKAPVSPEKVDAYHVLPKTEVDGVGLHEMGSKVADSHEADGSVVHELNSGDDRNYELPSSK